VTFVDTSTPRGPLLRKYDFTGPRHLVSSADPGSLSRSTRIADRTCAQARNQDAPPEDLLGRASPASRDETVSSIAPSATRIAYDPRIAQVSSMLRHGWGLAEVAGRLPVDFPNYPHIEVSRKTPYGRAYRPRGQQQQLRQCLPRCHKKRREEGPSGRIRWHVPIRDCPLNIEPRPRLATRNPTIWSMKRALVECAPDWHTKPSWYGRHESLPSRQTMAASSRFVMSSPTR